MKPQKRLHGQAVDKGKPDKAKRAPASKVARGRRAPTEPSTKRGPASRQDHADS